MKKPLDLTFMIVRLFQSLEYEKFTLDAFRKGIVRALETEDYAKNRLPFDMRSGLRDYYSPKSRVDPANSHILKNHESVRQLVFAKTRICIENGLMDHLSLILLTDFNFQSDSSVYTTARGYTPELFRAFVDTSWHAASEKEQSEQFIPDCIKLEIIRDTPIDIIREAGVEARPLREFIAATGRNELLSFLPVEAVREHLSDGLGL